MEITQQWAELCPRDKAKYTEQADERKKQYETEMTTFRNTNDCARYFAELRGVQRRRKVRNA